ncbi:family 20 glycosylhydrolase [Pseudoalteromonas piscicida]|uniref:beta-N-acetylhexosaminidase n=1 Tax=Pseudoalteromonas piscicida TaxID=43662 RepID=UPI002738CB50|nr:family 20 glycosylhydrolase [Pseudoalteromonas piscicida]MDP4489255.1 family 20 glycosylhydrolase [Pseudoalteromonas piscicida]
MNQSVFYTFFQSSLLLFSLLFTPLCAALQITPKPLSASVGNGHFNLTHDSKITFNQQQAQSVAQQLATFLRSPTGYQLPVSQADNTTKNSIAFKIVDVPLSHEGYALSVTPEGVEIQANTATGLFWGMQSLRQLLPVEIESRMPINQANWAIPAVEIKDQPRFSYRGMHLDVSRHFFDVAFVKRYIDWLAMHKFNVFQWHLTDDQGWRIAIDAYPKLTEIGATRPHTVVGHTYDYQPLFDNKTVSGFYTKAQIKEVIEYAQARHIEVIPEIDIPGHSSAMLAAYPELSCHQRAVKVQPQFGIFEDVLCPREDVFAFLGIVYKEVAELFPSQYIHIGGDEVIKKQWLESPEVKKLMQQHQLTTPEQVQSYFIKRVAKIVQNLGKTVIGWDEILEGGVADDAVIMSWRGTEGGIQAAKMGHQVIMSPYQYIYFDAYQSRNLDEPKAIHGLSSLKNVYQYEPQPSHLTAEQQAFIIGAQGALWTEYIKTPRHAEYMLFPRLSALAETLWSDKTQKSWSDYSQYRLPALLKRYQQMHLNTAYSSHKPIISSEINGQQLIATITSEIANTAIYYTLDGSEPTLQSQQYQKPLVITDETQLRARSYVSDLGQLVGDARLTLSPHLALGKEITLGSLAAEGSATKLQDGQFAYDQFYSVDDYAIFYDTDLEAVIDLDASTQVQQVKLGFDSGRHRQLHPPTHIQVLGSSDKQQWQTLAEVNNPRGPMSVLSFAPVSVRFLKVVAINSKQSDDIQIPKLPLYIDEIAVY